MTYIDLRLSVIAKNILKESAPDVSEKAKRLLFDPASEFDGFVQALRLTYGNTVPLFHATTPEVAKEIDKNGFALTYGRESGNWGGNRKIIYFQIGKSDYVGDERSVLYRLDAPVDWIGKWAEADMDSAEVDDEVFVAATGVEPDEYTSEQRDLITYFLAHNQTFEGMELLVTSYDDPNFQFPSKPIKIRG